MKLRNPFKSQIDMLDLADTIRSYRTDLERFTLLRDKSEKAKMTQETDNYNQIIDVMQKTLLTLIELEQPNES